MAPKRAAYRNVAEGGPGTHFDRLFVRRRLRRGVEVVVHVSETCLEVEPCGDTVGDSDIDPSPRRLSLDGAVAHFAETHIAVRGFGDDRRPSSIDDDVTVGAADPKISENLADPTIRYL